MAFDVAEPYIKKK